MNPQVKWKVEIIYRDGMKSNTWLDNGNSWSKEVAQENARYMMGHYKKIAQYVLRKFVVKQ